MPLPPSLRLNAWAGGPRGVAGPVAPTAENWSVTRSLPLVGKDLAPPEVPDDTDWQDHRVGWGLILPENEDLSEADRAVAADAPEPIVELVAQRKRAPVLRYVPGDFMNLRRYYVDRGRQVVEIASSPFGTGELRIPRYLLIYGSPDVVPWELQYVLNTRFAVGRLDLEAEALANYVGALLGGWGSPGPDPMKPLVWASDLGPDDMSATMREAVARPMFDLLHADADSGPGALMVGGVPGQATSATLAEALGERRPGLVVSTSHGFMGGLEAGSAPATVDDIGQLVGDDLVPVTPEALLAGWDPYGAIWYAHACCSAGSSAQTVYDGLFEAGSDVARMFDAVAGLGNVVSPFPTALLGHARPLRAFIGHVEPTFDWTITQPTTGQALTAHITGALYDRLYQPAKPYPIGLAFAPHFGAIGTYAAQQVRLLSRYNAGQDVSEAALAAQLSGRDRMSTVILGDPTVALDLANRAT